MIFRRRPGDQLAGSRVDRKPGIGHQRLQGGRQLCRVGAGDRIDLESGLLFRRHDLLDLLDRRLDGLVLRGRGHHQQAFARGVQGDLRRGGQALQHSDQSGRRILFQAVESQRRRVFAGLVRLEPRQRRSDRLLVGRNGQRDQRVGLGIDRHLGVRQQTLQQGQRRGRIGLGHRVDFQPRGVFLRRPATKLLHRRLDQRVILGRRPGDQLAGLRVDGEPGIGHQRLQGGGQLRRVGAGDRIDLESGLLLRRDDLLDPLDGRLDSLVIRRRGHHHQAFARGVQGDLCRGGQTL